MPAATGYFGPIGSVADRENLRGECCSTGGLRIDRWVVSRRGTDAVPDAIADRLQDR
jgi:hypothetical protein